jgi:hypothetical protein
MSANLPLDEALWSAYLDDELNAAKTDAQRSDVASLFRRALDDYQFVSVWLGYIQFMRDWCTSATSGTEELRRKARAVCNAAIDEIGASVADGARVWQAIAQFEMSLDTATLDNGARVRELALQRSTLLLENDDDVHLEYLSWEEGRKDAAAATEAVTRVQTNVMVRVFLHFAGEIIETRVRVHTKNY